MIKKIFKTILFIIIFFVFVYIFLSLQLTFKAKWIVQTVNDNYGIWNSELSDMLNGCVDEEMAVRHINYRTSGCRYYENEWDSFDDWRSSWIEEYSKCENFWGFIYWGGGIVHYKYSQHNISSKDGSVIPNGGINIPCTLYFEFRDWQWILVDYYEAP